MCVFVYLKEKELLMRTSKMKVLAAVLIKIQGLN
jgi:hypothetical protein